MTQHIAEFMEAHGFVLVGKGKYAAWSNNIVGDVWPTQAALWWRLSVEARRDVLKPLDAITDKLGDDYGELDAQEDMEKYVTETLAELDLLLGKEQGEA